MSQPYGEHSESCQESYFELARELLHSPLPSDLEYANIVALETQDELQDGCELCGSHSHSINYHHKELFEPPFDYYDS